MKRAMINMFTEIKEIMIKGSKGRHDDNFPSNRNYRKKIDIIGTSLVVQWIRLQLHVLNAGGPGSIPGLGTRSHMHAATKIPLLQLRVHMLQLRSLHAATNTQCRGFPCGTVVKNPPANAGDMGSSPGPGRSHMPWSN